MIKEVVEANTTDFDLVISEKRAEHEQKIKDLQEFMAAEKESKENVLKKRLNQRRKKKEAQVLEGVAKEQQEEELREFEKMERLKIEQEIAAREKEELEKESEKQKIEIQRLTQEHEEKINAQAKEAAMQAELTETQLDSLKQEHEQELEHLEKTLEVEKQRQISKMQERINKRRELKQNELQEKGAKEAEIQKEKQLLRLQEEEEQKRMQEELKRQAEQALHEEMERQEQERKLAAIKHNTATIQAAAAAAAVKAVEAMQQKELNRVTKEFESEVEKQKEMSVVERKVKKAKLQDRVRARQEAKKAALLAKQQREELELVAKQREEAGKLQARLEESTMAESWQDALDKESNAAPQETAEQKKLDEDQARKLSELEKRQQEEASRLASQQEREAREALEEEEAREQAAANEKLEKKRQEMEQELVMASANMVQEEFERIKKDFDGKIQDHASHLQKEQSKTRNDLKKRLEEKKRRKQAELLARQAREKKNEIDGQRREKEQLAAKAELEKEMAMIVKLIESGLVPESQVGEAIEMVLSKRHHRESSSMTARHYRDRSTAIRQALQEVMEQKSREKRELLHTMTRNGASENQRQRAMQELDARFAAMQSDKEEACNAAIEATQKLEEKELRERHMAEIATLLTELASEGILAKIVRDDKQSHVTEMQAFKVRLDRDTKDRIDEVLDEAKVSKEKISKQRDEKLAALDQEFSGYIEVEKTEGKNRVVALRDRLIAQKKKDLKEALVKIDETDKSAQSNLVSKFEKECKAIRESMEEEQTKQEADLVALLGIRRQRKRQRVQREAQRAMERKDEEAEKKIKIIREKAHDAFHDQKQLLLKKMEMLTSKKEQDSVSPLKKTTPSQRFRIALAKCESIRRFQSGSVTNLSDIQEAMTDCPAKNRRNRLMRQIERRASLRAATAANLAQSQDNVPPIVMDDGAGLSQILHSKLERIEALIEHISKSNKFQSKDSSNTAESITAAITSAHYGTQQDAARKPEGKLEAVAETDLGPRQRLRFKFGQDLLKVLGMDMASNVEKGITLVPAKSLPGSKGHANAFSNSMHYDNKDRKLYVRHTRMENASEFALIIVHAIAHIKVDPLNLSDDTNPAFITEFHRLMGRTYQEMFTHLVQEGANSTWTTSTKGDTEIRGASYTVEEIRESAKASDGSVPEYFKSDKLNRRLEKLQTFLATLEDPSLNLSDDEDEGDAARQDSAIVSLKLSPSHADVSGRIHSALKFNSTQAEASNELFTSNHEQQITMLQESLDSAERAYIEALKRFTDMSETIDVLKEALLEAQQDGRENDKVSLKNQIKEALKDLDRVRQDRDNTSKRCEELRTLLGTKQMDLKKHQTKQKKE